MNNVLLGKGIIHLMLPFRINLGPPENEIWTYADENQNFDFLLEHVREFFTKNLKSDNPDKSSCLILKLNKDALPVKMFNNRYYWLSNRPFDGSKKSEKAFRLPVYVDPASFRIIYHPDSGVAILLYSVELVNRNETGEKLTLFDFIRLNYLLRVFNRQDEAYFISMNERSEERNKASLLISNKFPTLFETIESDNIVSRGWRPGHLLNFLLCEINVTETIKFFNPCHFVPFSYFQPAEEIEDEKFVHRSLFYLRNVYDFDYMPAQPVFQSDNEFLHPFKQIFYAASIEGAVIFNNTGKEDPEFIRNFYSNSFKNSLWVALLGLMQRSIFLQLMKEVSDVDPDDHHKIKEYLRRYTGISLKALFSKISVYHQHNDFYELIIKNLQINELQTELKDELTELNNLLRQFHEDEVERHEMVEKQHEKKLNFILFALSVLSLAQISYTILGSKPMPLLRHLIAIGIPLGIGIVIWKILKIRKK